MGRRAGVYSLIQRENHYWYCRFRGEGSYKSTGTRDYNEALSWIEQRLRTAEIPRTSPARRSFREYSAVFFIPETCPHFLRLREEGRQITRRYAHNQRIWLDKYILKDAIADKAIGELTRGDVFDFRRRLVSKLGEKVNTANKVLGVLKVIIREAVLREDIDRDPTARVGNLAEHRKEAGVFTAQELRALFPLEGLGPWEDLQAKTVFLVAAMTGMRRGELLALKWRHIDFENLVVKVEEAWKGKIEIGPPKSGRSRVSPLTTVAAAALKELWESRSPNQSGSEALVFSYIDGTRLLDSWWKRAFASAIKTAGIDARARGIKPHSFRHTCATIRRGAGEDAAVIRAALGWSNERTQDGYTHFDASMLRSEILEGILKGS
jgi:integrase